MSHCYTCRWWNAYGNTKKLRHDTGTCMQAYKADDMPDGFKRYDLPSHHTCQFWNRPPDKIPAPKSKTVLKKVV